jgi:hypothetical protein
MIGIITEINITKQLLKQALRDYETREFRYDSKTFSQQQVLIVEFKSHETLWPLVERVSKVGWDLPIILVLNSIEKHKEPWVEQVNEIWNKEIDGYTHGTIYHDPDNDTPFIFFRDYPKLQGYNERNIYVIKPFNGGELIKKINYLIGD